MHTEFDFDPSETLAPGVAEGLQYEHVREMFADDMGSGFLGLKVTELTEDTCVGHFTVRPEMCNGHHTAHGGFLYAFADSLFAGASNAPGRVAVAAFNTMHYIAPVAEGAEVLGRAQIMHAWGRSGIVDVELSVGGAAVAEFRGTYRVLPSKPKM